MKTNFFSLLRRGAFYFCFVLISAVIFSCDKDDDDPIPPPPDYEFGEEFEDIEDLPEVTDEEPEIVEPETGEVTGSEVTTTIVDDIMGAETADDINAETKASLNAVANFAATQPAAVTEKAAALDTASVDALLDPETELDASMLELQTSLQDVAEELGVLLPELVLSTDLEEMEEGEEEETGADAVASTQKSPIFSGEGEFLSQTNTGPCYDAAQDAFDAVETDLTAQRDANLAIVEENYTTRIATADDRYESRLAAHAEDLAANREEARETTLSLLAAADSAAALGDADLETQLRQLALFYALDARETLETWNTLVLALLEDTLEDEKTAIEAQLTAATEDVNAAFDAAMADAQAQLNTIFEDCHDQGSGS